MLSQDYGSAYFWWLVGAAGVFGLILVGAGIWFAVAAPGIEEQLGTI